MRYIPRTLLLSPCLLLAACSQPQPAQVQVVSGESVPAPASMPASADATQAADRWHAIGTEPFWSVEATGGALLFKTPEDQVGAKLRGRRVPSLVGTVILGNGPDGEFHFGVTPGTCSDGMSDRSYSHHATFSYRGMDYKGCAEQIAPR